MTPGLWWGIGGAWLLLAFCYWCLFKAGAGGDDGRGGYDE